MGTFYARCKVENIVDRSKSAVISKLLLDTGSDYTWIPATTLAKLNIDREKKDVPFVMGNLQQITRSVGFAIIRLDKGFTVDEVVFAEKSDMSILGATTIEGLNLAVDTRRKQLVAAGPHLAAAASVRKQAAFLPQGARR
jgi:predicted aspartyl protease